MEAAVSSSALACSSVRELRSLLPCAICAEAVATPSAFWRTPLTTSASLSFMADRACSNWATSSRPPVRIGTVRSPRATASETSTAWLSERAMPRTSNAPNPAANSRPRPIDTTQTLRSTA
jgi:hypothetical protein